jgi:lipid II:glycine glycyltransferase (peptidoglycan interpeptide bridge formation enzyme)
LKLYRKDGTLVKDFGDFYKEYNDDFKADGYCWCAYWNANEMLKDYISHLIEKIRNEMADIEVE